MNPIWYQMSVAEALRFLATSKEGLNETDAQKRLQVYGKNSVQEDKTHGLFYFLFKQLKSPLVYILLFGALLSFFLQEWIDVAIILFAVGINVLVGFIQEYRSEKILEKLEHYLQAMSWVIRDARAQEIRAQDLVPGDIILFKSGSTIPADARLVESDYLKINESILTGESLAIEKRTEALKDQALLGDQRNMVFMGTSVERGEGVAVVVRTGGSSEIGKITLMARKTMETPTPLQLRIGRLGKFITMGMVFAALGILLLGWIQGYGLERMIITTIAVAVAAIPEGLPASVSIVLAVSAKRVLSRKGVVKHLLAAETLGSASVICTDKTGTLTEGKLKVMKVFPEASIDRISLILALANEAYVGRATDGKWELKGDSTDVAKLNFFLDQGGDYERLRRDYTRLHLYPFDPHSRLIASIHRGFSNKELVAFCNGAPENIARLCPQSELDLKQAEKLAQAGYRVLGIAERSLNEVPSSLASLYKEGTWKLIGFVGLRDTVRADVYHSILKARSAGIKVLMLTGDHRLTAINVGKELGFKVDEKNIGEGTQIDTWSEIELERKIEELDMFVRVTPEHKMRIIRAWQRRGEVVTMTGDGVNDAPALRAADIGVALGSGSDVAKEVSSLVLLDDSFSTLVTAIEQGRIAFDNIRKITVFFLAGSFTEILLICSSLIFGLPLPVTAAQMLWSNLVEDSMPNIALSFEPGEKDIMRRAPNPKSEPILDWESKIIIFVGFVTDFILVGIFFYLYFQTSMEIIQVRSFIFAALGMDTFFYIYCIKSFNRPIWHYSLTSNPYLLMATILGTGLMISALQWQPLNFLLGTVPLTAVEWVAIVLLGFTEIFFVELGKWFVRRKNLQLNY